MSVETYTSLVTSEYLNKPKFMAVVENGISPLSLIQDTLNSFIDKFDLDLAVGNQLDIIGLWVGASRFIKSPLTGIYFEWNNASVGWSSGIWQGTYSPTSGLTSLPDDVYRTLIRSKIAANKWDGTIPHAYEIWESLFAGFVIMIQDNQDMSIIVGVVGKPLDVITQALLTGGYLPLKPEGVHIPYYAVPVDENRFFAWGAEGSGVTGWGTGSWAKTLAPT